MNDNTPKREIHRLAIALDGVNKGLEAKFCNGEPILTIHPDGLVTASDRLKPTETAVLVLDQIKTRWLNDAQATKIRELNDRIKRLEEFVERFLNPEDLGWAIGKYDRDEAREALGMERVESKAKEDKP